MFFQSDAFVGALTWLAAVLFAVGLVTMFGSRRSDRSIEANWLDVLPAALGFLTLLSHIVLRSLNLGRMPVGNLHEASIFLALLLSAVYLVAAFRFRYQAVEVLLLAIVLGFLLLSLLVPHHVEASSGTAMTSRWFLFHALLSLVGVTALFAACVLSVLYVLADGQLKKKRPTLVLRFLPSLVACEQSSRRLLSFGFPLLTLSVLSGWLWSLETGRLWGPKELLAVAAWAIYAALLVVHRLRGFSGRGAAILSIAGAAAVLLAILGIRL